MKIAYCNACSKKLTARRFHLIRHESNEIHVKMAKIMQQTPKIQNALVKSANAEAAEEKLVMFAVEHNIAFRSMDHLVALVKSLATTLPQKELQTISCARTKATSIVRDRFGPLQQQNIAAVLKNCHFSILLDETTDVSSRKCLAVVVRYFHKKLETNFLALLEVPEATASILFKAIMDLLAKFDIPVKNLVGYGADNASTMMGSTSGLKAKFKEVVPRIFVFGCICHSLALCSSHAAKLIPDSIENFCHDLYNHFAHSAKRKSVFERFQRISELKPHELLRPAQTRWLSLSVSKI